MDFESDDPYVPEIAEMYDMLTAREYLSFIGELYGLKPEERNVKLDRPSYEQMLNEYYQLHGWDKQGKPLEKTKMRLGLAQ